MPGQSLLHCINQFALQDTNPVIAVLPVNAVVEFDRKYPNPILSFSELGLRAYYHCHTSAARPETEHGHFHIFIKIDDKHWSHLAGLSMDNLGQPIQWFTVNHWVTGETWETAELLAQCLDKLLKSDKQKLILVEEWLLAMLEFYQQSISFLIKERDQRLNTFVSERTLKAVHKDHAIYVLSQHDINLLNDIETYATLNGIDNSELEKYHP